MLYISGSGKTYAYLLPVVHNILGQSEQLEAVRNSPYCIIMVPSKELVYQLKVLQHLQTLDISGK
mgnify:CR=1 FL=1